MNTQIIFAIVLVFLIILVIFLQLKYGLLKDTSVVTPKPYSYARVQLVWWTFIVLSVFISVILSSGQIPDLNKSTLILLGLGALTTGVARIIDISDIQKPVPSNIMKTSPPMLSINQPSQGFILDILSDNNGVSIHRLQAVIFNFVFGLWFIYKSITVLKTIGMSSSETVVNNVIPVISDNNLILLALSAGTYAALKTTENK